MLSKKFLLPILTIVVLSGCSSPGPMQMVYGPIKTSAFDPIVLDEVKDGSKSVRFKEWTTMYENKKLQLWGVFFITDNAVYLADWDVNSYKYNLRYKLPVKDIKAITEDTVVRSVFPDSNLLVLSDKDGHKVGFALDGKNAARSILEEEIRGK